MTGPITVSFRMCVTMDSVDKACFVNLIFFNLPGMIQQNRTGPLVLHLTFSQYKKNTLFRHHQLFHSTCSIVPRPNNSWSLAILGASAVCTKVQEGAPPFWKFRPFYWHCFGIHRPLLYSSVSGHAGSITNWMLQPKLSKFRRAFVPRLKREIVFPN